MTGVKNRVALITGASQGIGLATAKLLLQSGARVMGVARTESTLKASGLPHYCVADLSTREGCQTAVAETLRCFDCEAIDILVCNHGMGSAHEKPLHLQEAEIFFATMKTNLEGPFHLTRAVLPLMVQQKYGRCVYTSSTASTYAEPAAVGYNTSKAGLDGLMRSVCNDGGPFGVTANSVLPGWVRTAMADRYAEVEARERGCTIEDIWKERGALYPAKRCATPEEVAATILFLASEESSGVSGEQIRVALGGQI